MREEKENRPNTADSFKPGQLHIYTHDDDSSCHIHNTAEILHQRLDSLNHLARRRSSFAIINSGLGELDGHFDPQTHTSKEEGDNLKPKIHVLAHRDTKLVPDTDAGKRLEQIFDRHFSEKKEDFDAPNKKSKKRKGLNRIQVKRCERRKKSIQKIQNQLKKNSAKNLSRSANSLRFHMKRNRNSDSKSTPNLMNDEFPIPVCGNEMDPPLLLTLSCEKLAIERGRRVLKAVVLHEISQKLFVLMYWFIHCRFFQKNSSPEQRHLLTKIANVFPAFINMLTVTASPKERDVIFRFYPFVLSKGIFIAFKFLCPGNRSLFKGAFQRILYLSIFRLLTGLDICPESIDALRLKLYPEDINEEDSDAADQDNELRPMGNERENQRSANVHLKSNLASELKNSKRSLASAKAHDTIRHSKRDSLVKFVGERDSLRYRPLKKLSPKKLPRQQQVKFDAYQISPLLQQHLGRESNSVGPKHFIKRTEPVAHCKSGGVETYQCLSHSRIIESEDQLLQEHKRKTNELKMASMKSNFSNRKQLKELQSQCAKILSGGREKVQEFASTISSGGTR